MHKITEEPPAHDRLEEKTVPELLQLMNAGDQGVAKAVERALPQITRLVEAIVPGMEAGGRLFYIGSGTSGRLGILDAAECPPTFGVPPGWVIGLIAGGDTAIRKAVEAAEDDRHQAWADLEAYLPTPQDTVIGLSASGTTPYAVGGVEDARKNGLLTGCITCNPGSPLAAAVQHPVEAITGPEFITGSTRLKAGTAQKMVLNMISTAVMVRLGRVLGNKMVDMQLNNEKLIDRGTRYVAATTGKGYREAKALLLEAGSVRGALQQWSAE